MSTFTLLTLIPLLLLPSTLAAPVQTLTQNGQCLQVIGTPANGAQVGLGGCNAANAQRTSTGQQWIISGGNNAGVQLFGTDYCLDAQTDPTPGRGLVIFPCIRNGPQTWYLTPDNRVAITGGTQCLQSSGTSAVTENCAPGVAGQAWTPALLFDDATPSSTSAPTSSVNPSLTAVPGLVSLLSSASVLSASASSAAAAASSVAASASSAASGAAASASSAVSGAAASASSAVSGASASASSAVASLSGSAASAAQSVSGAISSSASGAAASASSAGSSVVAGASSAAGSITSGAGSVLSGATSAPASVANSIGSAITSGVASATSAAGGTGGAVALNVEKGIWGKMVVLGMGVVFGAMWIA